MLKVKSQHLNKFHIEQLSTCRECLIEATESATKDRQGKPIFYTALKRKTRSGRTQAFSIHYFDDEVGVMRNLNYVASVLLNQRLDKDQRYIIVKANDFPHGQAVIQGLSKMLKFGRHQRSNRITLNEL